MQEIIAWLRNVELLACKVYQDAADRLSDDLVFSAFLSKMSEEESWHYHIIGSAARYLSENNIRPKPAILVDPRIRHEVEAPFHEMIVLLSKGKPSRQDVVDCIIETEFSELNFVFLYVAKTLSEASFAFQHVAATIEAHKKRIIDFLEELPPEIRISDHIYRIPKVWDKKFLIVDDEPPIRDVFAMVLNKSGNVETVPNGRAGLEKIKKSFYDVIISDINMPEMNGIEFYLKAVEINPNIYRKFLFVSGLITPDIRTFLKTNHLLWLEKPVNLKRFVRVVQEISDKTL